MSSQLLEPTLPHSVCFGNPFVGVELAGRNAELPPPFSVKAENACVSVLAHPSYAKQHGSDLHLTVYISDHCFFFAQEDAFSFNPCIHIGFTRRKGEMDKKCIPLLCVPAGLEPLVRAMLRSVGGRVYKLFVRWQTGLNFRQDRNKFRAPRMRYRSCMFLKVCVLS